MSTLTYLVARYAGPAAHELNNKQQGYGCIPYDPLADTPYHYIPHLAPGIIFTICFALAMVVHIAYMALSHKWWYASLWIGAMCETMGWAARLYSHHCPYNHNAFVMQISILILAPCFFSAGLYYIESDLIRKWGQQHSLISAKWYLWIFIGADIVSIAVQGAGGGLASSASSSVPPKDTGTGTHTMIGGIIVQLVSMSVFSFLLGWTCWSARANWLTGPNQHKDAGRMKLILATTLIVDALILARNYYRAVELGEGWDGFLNDHEAYFCIFDAALMVLAIGALAIFPPQFYLKADNFPTLANLENNKRLSDSDEEVAAKNSGL